MLTALRPTHDTAPSNGSLPAAVRQTPQHQAMRRERHRILRDASCN